MTLADVKRLEWRASAAYSNDWQGCTCPTVLMWLQFSGCLGFFLALHPLLGPCRSGTIFFPASPHLQPFIHPVYYIWVQPHCLFTSVFCYYTNPGLVPIRRQCARDFMAVSSQSGQALKVLSAYTLQAACRRGDAIQLLYDTDYCRLPDTNILGT